MRRAQLTDMVGGWFVGNFEPSVLKTADFEVAIKCYKAGDIDPVHYHRIATEITVIISGDVLMFSKCWSSGDIIVIEPSEVTGFKAVTDATTVVVKAPSALNDKFQ